MAEIACGGADISRHLVRLARRQGREIAVIGVDRNPRVLACARQWSRAYPEITFVRADALALPFPPGAFDIALLPAFLHHLAPAQVIAALRQAARISPACVIAADLARSPLAATAFRVFARLAGFSAISRHDGLCSLRHAYTPRELLVLAHQAGLPHARMYRHPWFRMTLVAGEGVSGV
ncbi:MAG: methyltransferase domain-containing protein [Armatimonadota bacterium]